MASWLITGVLLVIIVKFHLLAATFAGFLIYELVAILFHGLKLQRLAGRWAKLLAVGLMATMIAGLLMVGTILGAGAINKGMGALPAMAVTIADAIESSRDQMPPMLAEMLPQNLEELKAAIAGWLRSHAGDLRIVGAEALRAMTHILIGIVLGAILSLHEAIPRGPGGSPLAVALLNRIERFGDAFRRVVFAQVRIAGINAFLTWLYLGVALPMLGVDMPYVNILVGVTFVTGLLPVVGNVLSNTVIVMVSLSQSFLLAVGSLAFLVAIHTLEHFLNAHIIGRQIRSKAWELLIAMLVMEAVFGFRGLVAAPVFYAYLKDELSSRGLI
jgi:predicted PurR-regulated permease PerM